MEKGKIKKRVKPKIQYYIYCPICEKELVGSTPSQVEANLDTHLRFKHKEKK